MSTVTFRATIERSGKTATGIEVPADFAAALDADADAKRAFDGMFYSHRLRRLLSVEDAKNIETRRRRIAKAVESLRG